MQKSLFIHELQQHLDNFRSFSHQKISLNSPYFSKQEQSIGHFIAEIEDTAEKLITQETLSHSEYYADRLLKQFDTLHQAIQKYQETPPKMQFQSSFQFSPNVHRLPPEKRLAEYRKALRALNEKISWLMEQNYSEENEQQKQELQNQIAETEYRKMKCLSAIEDLEQELQFR